MTRSAALFWMILGQSQGNLFRHSRDWQAIPLRSGLPNR
jgi:hypothetical protein